MESARSASCYERQKVLLGSKENFMQKTGRTKKEINPPDPSIRQWHEMLMTAGRLQDTPRKINRPSRSEENVTRVIANFGDETDSLVGRAAFTLAMNHATVQRILSDSGGSP